MRPAVGVAATRVFGLSRSGAAQERVPAPRSKAPSSSLPVVRKSQCPLGVGAVEGQHRPGALVFPGFRLRLVVFPCLRLRPVVCRAAEYRPEFHLEAA